MILTNYPISEQDQQKLLQAGWTLVNALKKQKQIETIRPRGASTFANFDTQIDTGLKANSMADSDEKAIVVLDMNVRKPSVVKLLKEGYRIIRPREHVSSIFYCSSFGSWRPLYRLEEGESMQSAMTRHLEDSKTIHF